MIHTDHNAPSTTSRDATTPHQATESSGDTALVVLHWHRTSAWAWMTDGHGPTSRFAGFLRLADPASLPTRITALGWQLLAVRERPRGLVQAEIRIPLPAPHPFGGATTEPSHPRTA